MGGLHDDDGVLEALATTTMGDHDDDNGRP
jgi:hypothetical protein